MHPLDASAGEAQMVAAVSGGGGCRMLRISVRRRKYDPRP